MVNICHACYGTKKRDSGGFVYVNCDQCSPSEYKSIYEAATPASLENSWESALIKQSETVKKEPDKTPLVRSRGRPKKQQEVLP